MQKKWFLVNRKLKDASCDLNRPSPSPHGWMQPKKIKELKKGSGRKLIKSGAQTRLWDDCLELEFYMRPNSAWNLQNGWGTSWNYYVWKDVQQKQVLWIWVVWIGDVSKERALHHYDFFRLGRYLGPSINIGLVVMTKIIEENSQVFLKCTYQALTQE